MSTPDPGPSASPGHEFRGTARFELRQRLGAGGYGVVYAVLDRTRGEVVALKTLRERDPEALYRFKREFRALADVHHDNLARLYELHSAGEQWFFTMELVDGVDFLAAVRGDAGDAGRTSVDGLGNTVRLAPDELAAQAQAAAAGARALPDAAALLRLRALLRQLAAGVVALHRRGMQHRDLKPSNVLVSHGGRVVILDFGLVVERHGRASDAAQIVGTVEYMAPEQASGLPTSPASDWYSVGVMLFEALTGELPFTGSVVDMITQRIAGDAPAVRGKNPEAPSDLAALCMALLARDPEERPLGDEVLALLGAGASISDSMAPQGRPTRASLVGSSRVDLQACKLEYSIVSPK